MISRRILSRALLAAAVVSISTQAASADAGGPGTPEFRARMRSKLANKGFFRNATCAQVASQALSRSGLPRIGMRTPVAGERGDIDRRGERAAVPAFVDQIRTRKDTSLQITLRARGSEDGSSWALEIERARDSSGGEPATHAVTRFSFKVGSASNRPSCELQSIVFNDRSLGADECLDIFGSRAKAGLSADPSKKRLDSWLKEDCSLGLRYFESIKQPPAKRPPRPS